MKVFYLALVAILLCSGQCKKGSRGPAGKLAYSQGQVEIIRNGDSLKIKAGDALTEGDTIRTGPTGIAVIQMPGGVQAEVQSNSELTLSELAGPDKILTLHKGNNWLKVDRLEKGQSLQLVTPTTIASVRGTKFFTFQIGGMTGTCHCEGDVNFQVKSSNYNSLHHKDYIVVTRDSATALISPEEIMNEVGIDTSHHHSMLDDSPLGRKVDLTAEQMQKMMGLMSRKLKEAGAPDSAEVAPPEGPASVREEANEKKEEGETKELKTPEAGAPAVKSPRPEGVPSPN